MNKFITLLVAVGFISIFDPVYAASEHFGEVVRVNDGLKIVYAKYDKTPSKGQNVAVYENGQFVTPLKVILVTDTILQLVATQDGPLSTDFSKIKPGQKISSYDLSELNRQNNFHSAPTDSILEKDLEHARQLTAQLEDNARAGVSSGPQEMETEVDKLIEQNKRLISHLNHLIDENKALKAKGLNDRDELDALEAQSEDLKSQLKQLKEKLNNTLHQLEENINAYEN